MNGAALPAHSGAGGRGRAEAPEIVIVGGGFAGCAAAIALAGKGRKVVLIEAAPAIPNLFRAEKLAGDQLPLLEELGLLDDFKAASTPVEEFVNIRGRHIVDISRQLQLNMLYRDMIKVLRKRIPAQVTLRYDRVEDIVTGEDRQRVTLAGGETIEPRLVVLATGHGEALRRKLRLKRARAHAQQTISVAFTLTPPVDGFMFQSLTAYGESQGDRVDYISLFPIGADMRANLFLFSDIEDRRLKAIEERGMSALLELLPGLRPWVGDCGWVGDFASFPVELCNVENVVRPGLVVIGDAFRTSCPAVGTGLSCALVDVVCLRDLVGSWFATPGMGAEKIAAFYGAPRKMARDFSTHALAFRRRRAVADESRAGEFRQAAYYLARGLRDRLRRFAS
ncbi:FAD-dependent oxidoreductase [Rhodoblastus sp.]|uniref:FAD-dependent oxidoreductase n=1 Tax=Rhodoblastus sp. TaxID=1962975 RepID=UPI002638938A|nr:FAD-dependent oxidoreductase [Rhodoblastus sp.]